MKHVVEFRDEAGELTVGETVKADAFAEGDRVKISGVSKGKGFQGTIKRHGFASGPKSHGSHNVRAPGSIGAAAYPARVFKGIRGPGQMGNKRVTQKGLLGRARGRRQQPAARARLRAGPAQRRGGGAYRWLTPRSSARRRRRRSSSTTSPSARASTARSCTSPCARSSTRAARAPRRPRRAATSAAAAPSRGARRAPAAPAPARRARRSGPAAASSSGPTRATTPSRSTARSAGPRCAAR